jgi:ABC-2 type transport system ATP-binding protein
LVPAKNCFHYLYQNNIFLCTGSLGPLVFMIQFTDYKKFYGDNLIIDIPVLTLKHNIYWLKGENGCGKTTIIKSIAGLVPFDGTISVNGIDIKNQRLQYRSIVNYAEAEPLYPGFLTGDDLVRFFAIAKKANAAQVDSLIDAFGIKSFIGKKTGTYSSGMGKKLSLALGFMGQPKLILLDEPLITLDVPSVEKFKKIITEYYEAGVSFIITSH